MVQQLAGISKQSGKMKSKNEKTGKTNGKTVERMFG